MNARGGFIKPFSGKDVNCADRSRWPSLME
jgi:hypothetical protein